MNAHTRDCRMTTRLARTLRRTATVVAVVLAAPSAAYAQPASSPIDYAGLEQQIMLEINNIRQNPTQFADQLAAAPLENNKLRLPDGAALFADQPYVETSIAEARKQPPLPPLAWSESLARLGSTWLPNVRVNPSHGNYGERARAAGIQAMTIEAIGPSEASAAAQAWGYWISSSDGWDRATPFNPDYNATNQAWRGHRGIVNDNRMTAIGVACGPVARVEEPPQVVCVLNAGKDLSDQSRTAVTESGTPSLTQVPDQLTGSAGTATGGPATLTVNTSTPLPPASQPTNAGDPSAGTELAGSDSPGETTPPSSLSLGDSWDVLGDGSFLISVVDEGQFVPNEQAAITGGSAATYTGYQVKYINLSDTPRELPDVATWSCTTNGNAAPFVLQPPGQGLPNPGTLGRGAVVFAFGCGIDTSGTNVVSAVGGSVFPGRVMSWGASS